jgi:hypothetical protein
MEIKLKNIHVDFRMSEETNAFTADLFIDGVKAGTASNRGTGGMTEVRAKDLNAVQLIKDAETWCKKLPPEIVPSNDGSGKSETYPMSLDYFLDSLVDKHIEKLEDWRVQRLTNNSIIYGVPGGVQYRRFAFNHAIAHMVQTEAGIEALKNTILKKILPTLGEGEKILNKNIPQAIIDKIGLPKDKIVEPAPIAKKENAKDRKHAIKKGKGRGR